MYVVNVVHVPCVHCMYVQCTCVVCIDSEYLEHNSLRRPVRGTLFVQIHFLTLFIALRLVRFRVIYLEGFCACL